MTAPLIPVVRFVVSTVAVLFGIATLAAGGRVLLGADPGYVVFLPLLAYNTVMGVAYIAAGVAVWRNPSAGKSAAAGILALNVLVLGATLIASRSGATIANDSVRAMILRTVVWLALFVGAHWIARSRAGR